MENEGNWLYSSFRIPQNKILSIFRVGLKNWKFIGNDQGKGAYFHADSFFFFNSKCERVRKIWERYMPVIIDLTQFPDK